MGPLQGFRVIEIAGKGPVPFCGMMLGDMGADVIQVVRPHSYIPKSSPRYEKIDERSRRSIVLDLKKPQAADILMRLCANADALMEGFRPGVADKLGIGPEPCMKANPKLVYAHMTGWGQDGPLAPRSGHDINYLAMSGAMHQLGRRGEKPAIPLNYIADYAGGGMMLAFGLVCALLESQKSGKGQILDTAMIDGVATLQAINYEFFHNNVFQERGEHFLGGGHHSYETYETKDGRYMSVGAVESQFYAELIEKLGINNEQFAHQSILETWVEPQTSIQLRDEMAKVFKTKTQDEWCNIFGESDACVWPVLTLAQAAEHPHHVARGTFVTRDGVLQHQPSPRFSRTNPELGNPPRIPGEDGREILLSEGFSPDEIDQLIKKEVLFL